MSEDKICPFMSRPDNYEIRLLAVTREEVEKAKQIVKNIPFVPCQGERCMAWGCVEKFVAKDIKHEVYEHKVMGCRLIP